MTNPWNLTLRQCETLAALAEATCTKDAARILGCTPKTVEQHVYTAKKLMGTTSRVNAVVQYDRFARSQHDRP